jgi:hypothetical protein
MATETANYDQGTLVDLAGRVGAGEFNAARESTKAALRTWLGTLRSLSDDDLFIESQ